jgi:hypothetical protein
MPRFSIGLAVFAVLFAVVGGAHAMTISSDSTNIVELIQQSNDIVVGRVALVTDGLDESGIPYTEVTLDISESIRGSRIGAYKFRQFGLLKPRVMPDGKRKMMPGPTGFPKYAAGEDIVLFLRPSAAWTGFRMPAGVTQGKFTVAAGRAENDMGNAGLFRNVDVDRGVVTERDKRLLATASGPMNPDAFLSFVRRAVRERWVETEVMTRTDKRGGRMVVPPSELGDANDQTPTEPSFTPNSQTVLQDPNACLALPRSGR